MILSAPSPNHDARTTAIDTLVMHYTGMANGKAALDRMRDPQAKVSAHYMVEEDGSVIRLVEERRRAWHAGVSCWMGETNLNDRSIGIEIVNGGHEFGLPDFPDRQIEAVIALARDILSRRSIPQTRIVGHSDIAPTRKQDPGEKFPWRRLAKAGIGLWHDDAASPARSGQATEALAGIGYAVGDDARHPTTQYAITAFRRRFMPDFTPIDAVADAATHLAVARVSALFDGYRRHHDASV